MDIEFGYALKALKEAGKTSEEIRAAINTYLEEHPTALDQAAVEALFGERLDGIEEDAEALRSTIDYSYAIAAPTWESGGIAIENGRDLVASNRINTVSPLKGITLIKAQTGYSYAIYAWSGKTYIGVWNGTGWAKSIANNIWHTEETDVALFTNIGSYAIKIVLRRADNEDVSPTDSENITIYGVADKSLTQSGKPADAFETGKNIDRIKNALESIATEDNTKIYILDDIASLTEKKAINGSGDVITQSTSYCTERPIEIKNQAVDIKGSVELINAANFYQYIAVYDSNGVFLKRWGGLKNSTVVVDHEDIPANAKFMRWTLSYVGIGNVASCELSQYYSLKYLKASPKNKWYVLGDSISAGYYSMTESMAQEAGVAFYYTSPVTTESGEATGSVWDETLAHNYWNYANQWRMKRELVGMAQPGQGYFRTASNSQNGVYVVTHHDFSDAGLITIAWGFNDWHYNMERGNHDLIDASTPYPGENYDTTQITTVNQAIWFCLGELIRQAPNAKIVVQTPMNGWAYGGDFASNWGIGTAKSNSGTLADIHDDIVYWANYYGLQVLEMTYNNSIVNRRNIKDVLIDGSHPSDAAHQQLGRHVAALLGYC